MEPSQELYKEIILDHSKYPRKYNLSLEGADVLSAKGRNPICGDEYSLKVKISNGIIKETSFSGHGCAISKASASIMTELIQGISISEASVLEAKLRKLLTSGDQTDIVELNALGGVKDYPDRIHCAQLAWNILSDILKNIST